MKLLYGIFTKADLNLINQDFLKEMSTREPELLDWRIIIRLIWWGYARKYRMTLFMLLCCDGYNSYMAYKKVSPLTKSKIIEELKKRYPQAE